MQVTFRLVMLISGAVAAMCAAAYTGSPWWLLLFPLVLTRSAIRVLTANDAPRSTELQRRDRRAILLLTCFAGGLVLLAGVAAVVRAVAGW